jgi:rubrerythrin
MRRQSGTEDYVELWTAGDVAKGEFQCSDCGYGVTIARELPPCPMCGGRSWEQAGRHGFRRVHRAL